MTSVVSRVLPTSTVWQLRVTTFTCISAYVAFLKENGSLVFNVGTYKFSMFNMLKFLNSIYMQRRTNLKLIFFYAAYAPGHVMMMTTKRILSIQAYI